MSDPAPAASEIKSEERLIPVIRARLAERLAHEGFRINEIARALKVTQPAVTHYLQRKRGTTHHQLKDIDPLVDPLAEKLIRRIRSGSGGIEAAELLETARQVIVMNAEGGVAQSQVREPKLNRSLELLRNRLQLELTAAEKYLELANKTSDDHTKMLLRMIASDSIRHADVVSQVISWLQAGGESRFEAPREALLRDMLSLEDSAKEVSLRESVDVGHPVAQLLLEWVDIDERKHERLVTKMLRLGKT